LQLSVRSAWCDIGPSSSTFQCPDRRLRGRSARRSQGWPANSPGHLVDTCLMTRLAASPRFTCSRRTSRTRIGRVTLQVAAPDPGSRTPLIGGVTGHYGRLRDEYRD
jgi:hypothetical protein